MIRSSILFIVCVFRILLFYRRLLFDIIQINACRRAEYPLREPGKYRGKRLAGALRRVDCKLVYHRKHNPRRIQYKRDGGIVNAAFLDNDAENIKHRYQNIKLVVDISVDVYCLHRLYNSLVSV